jgi:hypothetical protein
MFEITADDVAALNDEDLRTFVARLCEAELRRHGLSVAAVTWGGNQNAADAGLDVRIALPPETQIGGFIPRPSTGFQVKKPDMPRNAILAEMKPSGVVRPVITELMDASGAYIIVSSGGSTSDSALRNRRNAMAEAVADLPNAASLALEFYDRQRLATWVRDHPGLIPWVRDRIGKAVPGWRSYGAWAFTPQGADAGYLVDDAARIYVGGSNDKTGLLAVDGINRMRGILRETGKVVRLVGLSGVGKTRLVQALFDDQIGEHSLDPSLAIYTNVADGPDPQPRGLASDLIAARTRAILAIDNCPPDLHHSLSELVRASGSTLSLITIEYDIRDDLPEGTDVFTLEPSSVELVEKLVRHRYADLSQVDARTIADFSGGNARVAIALAETIGKNETIAGLSNTDLFRRLFQQRHGHDENLLLIAQACSLLYSFQGEALSGDEAELPILGRLVGKSADEVFRGVAELKRRDLVQQRGKWRAVLPHAIANQLAEMALQNIPYELIQDLIINRSSERILRSFSRRLGFLDSAEARAIVERWLSPGELLGDIAKLSDLGMAMVGNIAPAAPGVVLGALERAFAGPEADAALARSTRFIPLLRSLAYDAAFFERAVSILVKFAEREGEDSRREDATRVVTSLCQIYLSGTLATVERRACMVEALLRSDKLRLRNLGAEALHAALEATHFTSSYSFEFGSRSRDYGWFPKTFAEQDHWFQTMLTLGKSVACSDEPAAARVMSVIAGQFRGVWTNAGMFDALEDFAQSMLARGFWRDGWIAVRQTRLYDGKGLPQDILGRLSALEARLRPTDLVNKVRAIILNSKSGSLDLDDFEEGDEGNYEAAAAREAATVVDLGKDTAKDEESLSALLPELLSGSGRLHPYGHGLALGADEPQQIWDRLVRQYAATPDRQRSDQILRGFLSGLHERDPTAADALLDAALKHEVLGPIYPILQIAVPIAAAGNTRLKRALELDRAPIANYQPLAYGRAADPIPGPEFKELMARIAAKPSGFEVAIEILSMRLHSDRADKRAPAPETIAAGRALMADLQFAKDNDREDYQFGIIARACLAGHEGEPAARSCCRKLRDANKGRTFSVSQYDDFLTALAAVQPEAILDELLAGGEKQQKAGLRLLEDVQRNRKNPLDAISDEAFLRWCDRKPSKRYRIAGATISCFRRPADESPLAWTSLALQLLAKAPSSVDVAKEFVARFHPTSFSGSLAAQLESRAKLLDDLDVSSDSTLAKYVAEVRAELAQKIEARRRTETERDRSQSERFE